MAFPTIPTGGRVVTGVQANATATRTFPDLSGLTKNKGDLLIAIVVAYQSSAGAGAPGGTVFSSWSAGWTEFCDQMTTNSSTMAIGAAWKISDGTETGTISTTQIATVTGQAAFILLSIPDGMTPAAGTIANGTSAAANPASFDPAGWGAEDTLWISVGASGETSTSGSFTGIAGPPANYTDGVQTGISQDAVGGVEGAVAFRQLNASSEDVGTRSVDTSNARNSALVIAVRPAYVKTGAGVSECKASGADATTFSKKAIARPATTSVQLDLDIASGADDGETTVAVSDDAGPTITPFLSPTVVRVGLMRWDTSAIPDSATVTAAVLRAYVISKTDPDGQMFVAEAYDAGATITTADFSGTPVNDAHTGTLLFFGVTAGASNDFAIQPSVINKTGFTGLRLYIDEVDTLTGDNQIEFASFSHGTHPKPQLRVTYSIPGSQMSGGGVAVKEEGGGNTYEKAGIAIIRPQAYRRAPVLTNFTGSDEDPLSEGGLWAATTIRVDTATIDRCQRVGNRAIRASNTLAAGESLWATTFGADQEVFVTLAEHRPEGFGLYARVQNEGTSSVVAYHLSINDANGFRFFRLSNTTFTQIGSAIAQAVATGDSMGLVVRGTTLEAWFKAAGGLWTLLGSVTNANVSGAGKIGITIGANHGTDLDDFGGGTITVGGENAVTYSETGTATSAGVASGTDAITHSEAGAGVIGMVASGSKSVTRTKTGTAISRHQTYPNTFTTPILDTFTGSDETPIATNWSSGISSGEGGARRVGNQFAAPSGGGWGGSYYDLADFGPDVEAYVTLATVDDAVAIWARLTNPGGGNADGYQLKYEDDTGGGVRALIRMDNGVSFTTLDSSAGVRYSAGDKLGIRIIGSRIEFWAYTSGAWGLVFASNSFTYSDAGRIGLEVRDTVARLDDFGGGTITVSFAGTNAVTYSETGTATSARTSTGADEVTFAETGAGTTPFTASGADAATHAETGLAQTGNVPFPQFAATVTDDFNRANENPISGNGWDGAQSTARIEANQLHTADGEYGLAYRSSTLGEHEVLWELAGNVQEDDASGWWTTNDGGSVIWNNYLPENLVQIAGAVWPVGDHEFNIPPLATGDAIGVRLHQGYIQAWVRASGAWTPVGAVRLATPVTEIRFLDLFDEDAADDFALDNFALAAITGPLYGNGMVASGVAEKISGGTTTEKVGAAITGFSASGADAVTFSRAGTAVSAFTALGADAITFAEAGTGISAFVDVGDATSTLNRTGSGVSTYVGSGADALTLTQTGAGVIQAFIASGNSDEALIRLGTGIAIFVASGTDAITSSETGTGVATFVGSGADAYTASETGTGVASFVGSGDANVVISDTGAGVIGFSGSGTRARELARAGAGVAVFVASGIRARELPRTGAGITPFIASGADSVESRETGTGVTPFSVSGTQSYVYAESGTGVTSFTASGVDAFIATETGSGSSEFTGAADGRWIIERTGAGVSTFAVSGNASDQQENSGAGVAVFTGSGVDEAVANRTGAGVIPFVSSGADEITFVESGTATAVFTGSADAMWTVSDTGTGTIPFVSSGDAESVLTRTGTGIVVFSGSGVGAKAGTGTGTGISEFVGSGADAVTHAETGAGIAPFTATATKTKESTQSGAGITEFKASGADATTHAETGTAVAVLVISGADAISFAETGAGILDNLVGASFDTDESHDTGTGVIGFTGSASKSVTFAKTGAGIAIFVASGVDAATSTETGAGILDAVASGVTDSVFGQTYEKAGSGIAAFVGSGTDTIVFDETGNGVAVFSGSGARAREILRTGSGVTEFVATGDANVVISDAGTGIAPFSGTGAQAKESAQSRAGILVAVSSGTDSVTFAETGAGIALFVDSGTKSTTFAKTGTGSAVFVASADGRWEVTESGIGVIGAVGSGDGDKQGDLDGTGISEFSSTADGQWIVTETGSGVSSRVSTGADSWTLVETGDGIAIFTASGDRSIEHLRSGTAVASFTGTADATWNVNRLGSGILDAVASGDQTQSVNKSSAGIINFTGSGTGSLQGDKTGAGTSFFIGSGTRFTDHLRDNTAVSEFTTSGADVTEFGEAGMSFAVFSIEGDSQSEFSDMGAGVVLFAGSGADRHESDETGSGVVVFVGAGSPFVLSAIFLGEITATVVTRPYAAATVTRLENVSGIEQSRIEATVVPGKGID